VLLMVVVAEDASMVARVAVGVTAVVLDHSVEVVVMAAYVTVTAAAAVVVVVAVLVSV
jgi:hypothetical protein